MYSKYLLFLVPLILACLAYANSFDGQFVFDDHRHLVGSEGLHTFPPQGWPLAYGTRLFWALLMSWDWMIWGNQAWGWHWTNLVIHLIATFGATAATYLILQTPKGSAWVQPHQRVWIAAAVASLWTVHPLLTQAVTYIVQRAESFTAAMVLLGLVAFLRFQETKRLHWALGSYLLFWLALGTKEVAFGALLGLPLVGRCLYSLSWKEVLRQQWRYFLGLISPAVLLLPAIIANIRGSETNAAGFQQSFVTWYEYLWTQPEVLLYYLRLAFVPWPQCFDYAWPVEYRTWAILSTFTLVATIFLWALRGAWQGKAWESLALWFFLILLPSSSIIPLRDLAVEHRMYLPLLGLIAAGTGLAYTAYSKSRHSAVRPIVLSLGLLLCGTLLTLTHLRNKVYHDDVVLWTDTLKVAPLNARAHYILSELLVERKEFAAAKQHVLKACELDPTNDLCFAAAAHVLRRAGDPQAGEKAGEIAVRLNPDSLLAWWHWGQACEASEQYEKANKVYVGATTLFPEHADFWYRRGVVASRFSDWNQACDSIQRAVELEPRRADFWYDLGLAYREQGNLAQALDSIEQALKLRPSWAEAIEQRQQLLKKIDASRL